MKCWFPDRTTAVIFWLRWSLNDRTIPGSFHQRFGQWNAPRDELRCCDRNCEMSCGCFCPRKKLDPNWLNRCSLWKDSPWFTSEVSEAWVIRLSYRRPIRIIPPWLTNFTAILLIFEGWSCRFHLEIGDDVDLPQAECLEICVWIIISHNQYCHSSGITIQLYQLF